jgi:hypothetical protein
VRAVVLVPFRPDGAERDRNWDFARELWHELGLPIFAAGNEGPTFERAEARNIAAKSAGAWDVALFADADVVLESVAQADAAIMRAYRTGAYTVAYSHLSYLTPDGTLDAIERGFIAPADWVDATAFTWECCFAVRRDLFDRVGGFDERFRGWGYQVSAFFYACGTLAGRERIEGRLFHLDHPLVDRDKEPHFLANAALAERYLAAVDDEAAMSALLGER